MLGLISRVRISIFVSFSVLIVPLLDLVAYKRFVDNVPLAIDYELVRGVERGLLSALYTGLGVNSEDGTRISKELAQESSGVAHRRAELGKKLERLRIASEELFRIGV
jgi:hypothetical protein